MAVRNMEYCIHPSSNCLIWMAWHHIIGKCAHWGVISPNYSWVRPCPVISVQFSLSVMSDSLLPHELQHPRPPFPSPTPRGYSNSCPLSCWCHPTISSSVVPFSSRLQSFPASVFSNESALRIRGPKYRSFSFSISPSNEYSGLMSFRVDLLDLPAVQGTLKSLLQHHSSKASILQCSTFSPSHQSAKMHSPRQHRDIQGWKLRHTLYKFNM